MKHAGDRETKNQAAVMWAVRRWRKRPECGKRGVEAWSYPDLRMKLAAVNERLIEDYRRRRA